MNASPELSERIRGYMPVRFGFSEVNFASAIP